MSGKQWYYGQNGDQFGPVTWEQLRQLAASGRVRGYDLVWCEGMTEWEPAERVAALFPAAAHVAQPEQRWRPPTGPPPSYGPPPSPPGGARSQYYAPDHHRPDQNQQAMAVAGFVCAFLLPPIGLVLSWIALSNMKASGHQEGRGFALAGVIISGIFVGGGVLFVLAMFTCAGAAVLGM
jgi:hypothetical protein